MWHVSHAAVVFGWVAGLTFTPAYCPAWQVAHPLVIPAWFIVQVANDVVLVWQVSHAAVVAMCVAEPGFAFAPGY